MVSKQAMLAIATAVVVLSAFSFSAPLLRAASASSPSPIPAPASCTYTGHPTSPLSQTTVAVDSNTVTKHAEKELYNCIISGSTKHYILDTTTYTTIREAFSDAPINPIAIEEQIHFAFVECAKDAATATVYSCQTEAVGSTLATTSSCSELGLGFPQEMNTVVVNGVAKTIESQKEIFKCSTSNGPIIEELIIWTIAFDNPTDGSAQGAYLVETCQKPATITTGLPLLNCGVTGNFLLP